MSDDLFSDVWDVSRNGSGYTVACPVGPRHIWTWGALKYDTFNEAEVGHWWEWVQSLCYGPNTKETIQRLIDEHWGVHEDLLAIASDEQPITPPPKKVVPA